MNLLGLIILLATTWYIVKVTWKLLDEPAKKDISNSFYFLKKKIQRKQTNFLFQNQRQ